MSENNRFRFSLRSIFVTLTFLSLLIAFILQSLELKRQREQIRLTQHERVLPAASCSGISFVEAVQIKDGSTYINKVYIAEDGRKRSESITGKHSLISVYDDWGLHRVSLRPKTKTATEYAAVEEFGKGTTLDDWLKQYLNIAKSATNSLGHRDISGITAIGCSKDDPDGKCELWVNEETGELMQVMLQSQEQTSRLFDIQYYDTLDENLFLFSAPLDYKVVRK